MKKIRISKLKSIVLFLCLVFMNSCGSDESLGELDIRLNEVLTNSSATTSKEYYLLPKSDQFSKIPQDPKNILSAEKIELGKLLFHESAFSTIGNFENMKNTYSCASCHHAKAGFQANLPQGIADGGQGFGFAGEARSLIKNANLDDIDVQPLRTPSAMNLAYQTNLLWNGQFGATALNKNTTDRWKKETPLETNELGYEGLETQAIAGITVHRMEYNEDIITSNGYKEMFDKAFTDINKNDRYTTERAGQAIAAYERILISNQAPFQEWLRGDEAALTENQKEGAIIFFTKGQCNQCHDGPALAKMEFHALGMDDFDPGKVFKFDPLDPATTGRASFTGDDDDKYKFKVPQLYNLKDSPFYGHGASFTSLKDVIEYKNIAAQENQDVDNSFISDHFIPLNLTPLEINQLVDFLEIGLYDPNLSRYVPIELPTGNCFPNNDDTSKQDLGCF